METVVINENDTTSETIVSSQTYGFKVTLATLFVIVSLITM